MVEPVTLKTERLVLRPWRPEDRAPFAEMNADPAVMEHFPAPLSADESDTLVDRIEQRMAEQGGWGLWAVEVPGVAPFIGFIGLNPGDAAVGRPCIEVGWRLAAAYWGRGYAPEGARAALEHGFEAIGLDEIVSFTVPGNTKSRRVMEKIGLTFVEEFDHVALTAQGHPLRRHVLYRIDAATWTDRWRMSVTGR